jgi:hypothetical protein
MLDNLNDNTVWPKHSYCDYFLGHPPCLGHWIPAAWDHCQKARFVHIAEFEEPATFLMARLALFVSSLTVIAVTTGVLLLVGV